MDALLYDINPAKTYNPDFQNELLKSELSGESRLYNKEFLVSVVNSDPDDVYGTMKRLLEGSSKNRPIVNVAYRAEQSFKEGVLLSQRDELRKSQKRRTITPTEADQIKYQITDFRNS